MRNGFFRVAACVPPVRVADVRANADAIIDMLGLLDRKGVELAVFPELCVTGYTCLVYTSPSPGGERQARMPSSA
ncbi:MAG: hypothetical protein K2G84_04100 [Muribaculaceae bacterium]|nr:hypothetical protein [Muribaculaceae bacterium]